MKTTPRLLQSIALASLLSASTLPAFAATDYKLTLLEDNGYGGSIPASIPLAIASNGLVAGTSYAYGNSYFWSATGNRLYSDPQPATYAIGYAINKNGLALVDAMENGDGHLLWNNGKYSLIPYSVGYPTRINDAGQIATRLPNGNAGLWNNGTFTDLGVFPGGSGSTLSPYPIVIGNNGQIVGSAITSGGAKHAALWKDGTVIDLGTLPGDSTSIAMNINDAGEVVGFSYSATQSRPFRWVNGVMSELAPAGIFDTPLYGTLGNSIIAKAMNSLGHIVGETVSGYVRHPFAWGNGVLTDLRPVLAGINTGANGCLVNDINDAGQIVGVCAAAAFILTPVTPGTNLSVSMAATPNPVSLGSALTYNLSISNAGSVAATGVNLVDALPASTSFKSATSSQGSCSGAAVITCALGDLAGGASATVQIAVIPNLAGTLSNSASVSSNEVDADVANNSATSSVTVSAPVATADVGVSMTGSASTIARNSNLTYTIKVTNSGPDSAGSITLKDVLPSAMKLVSATTSQGTCSGTTTVTCAVGTLVSGGTASISIVVKASSRGTFTNTATVSTTTKDNNTVNNSSSVTTKVN
jgi:uncharacterized repeat protein (TIGR01451 family)